MCAHVSMYIVFLSTEVHFLRSVPLQSGSTLGAINSCREVVCVGNIEVGNYHSHQMILNLNIIASKLNVFKWFYFCDCVQQWLTVG